MLQGSVSCTVFDAAGVRCHFTEVKHRKIANPAVANCQASGCTSGISYCHYPSQ